MASSRQRALSRLRTLIPLPVKCALLRVMRTALGERAWLSYLFYKIRGRMPDLRNPRLLNEKILCKMLNDRRSILNMHSDKLRARDFVRERRPDLALPAILWQSTIPASVPLADLPDRFVLKASHGSGWVKVVHDKRRENAAALSRLARRWLRKNYYFEFGGWAYKDAVPAVYAEEFLGADVARAPDDYKLFVFNGRLKLIQIDRDRFGRHTQRLYDRDWRDVDGSMAAPRGAPVPRPLELERMIEAAEALSDGIDIVRVDLYVIGDRVYFGEFTDYPNGGFGPIDPLELDEALGSQVTLDDYSKGRD